MSKETFLDYRERNKVLCSLGFSSYSRYQESYLWASIRLKVLQNHKWACVLCKGAARVVHYSQYTLTNLQGISLDYLHAICHACHHIVEFDGTKKLTVDRASKKFRKLLEGGTLKKSKAEIMKASKARRKKGGRPEIGLAHKRKHLARRRS